MANLAQDESKKAHVIVSEAIRSRRIIRGKRCEVCDTAEGPMVGHHWEGYHKPLSLWWVCRGCNSRLSYRHDGSLTLEQARELIQADERIYHRAPYKPSRDGLVSVVEAAQMLGPTTVTIHKWIRRGYFPNAYKQDPFAERGSQWRIPIEDIVSFQERRKMTPFKNTRGNGNSS